MTTKAPPPFYMIRHGETDWNREKRYQGQVDVPLNALGRNQARAYGRHLATLDRDWSRWRFFASPLGRARETMELLRGELGLAPRGYEADDRLIEITFGDWERKRLVDLEVEEPAEMQRRNANKWEHVPPGGESYAQAIDRVAAFLDDLPGPAVIVCHGGVLRATQHIMGETDVQALANSHVPQDRIYVHDGARAYWTSQA